MLDVEKPKQTHKTIKDKNIEKQIEDPFLDSDDENDDEEVEDKHYQYNYVSNNKNKGYLDYGLNEDDDL